MLDPPELVMVADCFWLLPTCTVPKAMMLVPEVSEPGVTAEPERATFIEAFVASLVIATLPLALPAAFGAKVTVRLALCPVAIVAGKLIPEAVNPVPVTAAWLMVRLALPVLLSTMVLLELVFTCMLPKLRLVGLEASWPWPAPLPDSEIVVVPSSVSSL